VRACMCVCERARERERENESARTRKSAHVCARVRMCSLVCMCWYARMHTRTHQSKCGCVYVCACENISSFFFCVCVSCCVRVHFLKNLKRHSVCPSESTKKKSARFSMSSLCTRQSNVVQTNRQVENVMICPRTKFSNSLH